MDVSLTDVRVVVDKGTPVEPIGCSVVARAGFVPMDSVDTDKVLSMIEVIEIPVPLENDPVDWSVIGLLDCIETVELNVDSIDVVDNVSGVTVLPVNGGVDAVVEASAVDPAMTVVEELSVSGVGPEFVIELDVDNIAVEESTVPVGS